jgi:hypothetical protein
MELNFKHLPYLLEWKFCIYTKECVYIGKVILYSNFILTCVMSKHMQTIAGNMFYIIFTLLS